MSAQAAESLDPRLHRVMLVEDQELMRFGLRSLLRSMDDVVVVAEADSVPQAIAEAERTRPDLVIMDSRVREGGGVQATLAIRGKLPDTRVLMLSSFPEDDTLYAAIVAGASGFLLKHVKADDLVKAVRGIFQGQSLIDPAVTTAVLRRIREGGPPRDEKLSRLSEREEEILSHIARGQTNAEIARTLHYSERAVKKAVTRILSKLEVRRRSEAAAYYASHPHPNP